MDEKQSVQDIINALKTLRLQEAELSSQLEAAIGDTASKNTSPPRITEKRRNTDYTTGDRIWIKNKIKKPANWTCEREWNEKEAKTATVTEVLTKGANTQIHFVTDNGVHTWRAPNNVSRISAEYECR